MEDEPLVTPAEAGHIAEVAVDGLMQAKRRGTIAPAKTVMRGRKPEHYYRPSDVLRT